MQRSCRSLGFRKVAAASAFATLTTLIAGCAGVQTSPPPVLAVTPNSALVVVVRHAERGTDDLADPTLTPAGLRRAEALAVAVEHLGVNSIITTHLKRTQLTAQPTALKSGAKVTVVTPKRGDTPGHIADVVAAVEAVWREQKGAVLVVGHSNTVPLIVKALSGVSVPNMCESQHADFYLVALPSSEKTPARLLHTRYGEAEAPPSVDCK
jgi:phosphohistidine phosphatase SixA